MTVRTINFPLSIALYATPFILVVLWLAGVFETALNYDHAFLLEAARRMVDGARMSEAYFDTNPPLSVIFYAPIVFMERSGLFPAPYTIYTYTAIVITLFSIHLLRLARYYPEISSHQKIVLFFGFIIANTTLTASRELFFGERDQFIFIGLLTILLYQDILLRKPQGFRFKPLDILILALATFCILLKPHYLLVPALMALYRLYKTRDFPKIILSPDTLVIAAVTAAYILSVFIFFPDFIDIILPLVMDVYLPGKSKMVEIVAFQYGTALFAFTLLCFLSGLSFDKTALPLRLFGVAALCFLLFWVQGKGFYYHIFPMLGFMTMGGGLLLYNVLHKYTDKQTLAALAAMLLLFTGSLFATAPVSVPTHQDYKTSPLSLELAGCKKPCSFYMLSFSMDVTHQLAYYNDVTFTSRFPTLWWLQALKDNPDKEWGPQMIALFQEDMDRYKPDYLILVEPYEVHGYVIDMKGEIMRDPWARDFMKDYRIVRSQTISLHDYLGKTNKSDKNFTYLIYKRNVN